MLCDDLHQRAARGALVVKLDLRIHFHLGGARLFRPQAVAQHAIEVNLTQQHPDDAALEALPFLHVQFQRAEAVGEVKRVHHDAGLVREGVGLHDVHAPRRQDAGNPRKQERAIIRDQRQFKPVPAALQLQLHRVLAQPARHLHMGEYIGSGVGGQVSLG